MVNIHEKLLILNYPLRILHQLADFLQRGDVTVNIHEKLLILTYPLRILRQLGDFLQRRRCDGQYTQKTFQTVSI